MRRELVLARYGAAWEVRVLEVLEADGVLRLPREQETGLHTLTRGGLGLVVGSGVRLRNPLMLGALTAHRRLAELARKGVAMLWARHILLALPELVDEVAKTL